MANENNQKTESKPDVYTGVQEKSTLKSGEGYELPPSPYGEQNISRDGAPFFAGAANGKTEVPQVPSVENQILDFRKSFQELYEKSIFQDNYLIMNDIVFSDIPSTAISFKSENGAFIAETLRSDSPIVSSNNAHTLTVEINLIFKPETSELFKLERLMAEVTNHPLVYIYNNKIRMWLGAAADESTIFIFDSGYVQSDASAIGCIKVALVLHYFNYKPFTSFFWYNSWVPGDFKDQNLDEYYPDESQFEDNKLVTLHGYEGSEFSINTATEDMVRQFKKQSYVMSKKDSINVPTPFPFVSESWKYLADHLHSKANTLSIENSDYISFSFNEYEVISPPKGDGEDGSSDALIGGGTLAGAFMSADASGFPTYHSVYGVHNAIGAALEGTHSRAKIGKGTRERLSQDKNAPEVFTFRENPATYSLAGKNYKLTEYDVHWLAAALAKETSDPEGRKNICWIYLLYTFRAGRRYGDNALGHSQAISPLWRTGGSKYNKWKAWKDACSTPQGAQIKDKKGNVLRTYHDWIELCRRENAAYGGIDPISQQSMNSRDSHANIKWNQIEVGARRIAEQFAYGKIPVPAAMAQAISEKAYMDDFANDKGTRSPRYPKRWSLGGARPNFGVERQGINIPDSLRGQTPSVVQDTGPVKKSKVEDPAKKEAPKPESAAAGSKVEEEQVFTGNEPDVEDPSAEEIETQKSAATASKNKTIGKGAGYIIGDSIAVGLAGNSTVEGLRKQGQRPNVILAQLKAIGKEELASKTIRLSTGILNGPKQRDNVEKQLAFLKEAGAKVQLVGCPKDPIYYNSAKKDANGKRIGFTPGPVVPHSEGSLDFLKEIAEKNKDFVVFLGEYEPSGDGVHPASYTDYTAKADAISFVPVDVPPGFKGTKSNSSTVRTPTSGYSTVPAEPPKPRAYNPANYSKENSSSTREDWIADMENEYGLRYYSGDSDIKNVFYGTYNYKISSELQHQHSNAYDSLRNIVCSSISISFGNRLVPQRLISQSACTYQFLGSGNVTGTIVLTFGGEEGKKSADILKGLYHKARQNAIRFASVLQEAGEIILEFDNPYTNTRNNVLALLDVNSVIINEIQEASVPNNPDLFELIISFIVKRKKDERLQQVKTIALDNKVLLAKELSFFLKSFIDNTRTEGKWFEDGEIYKRVEVQKRNDFNLDTGPGSYGRRLININERYVQIHSDHDNKTLREISYDSSLLPRWLYDALVSFRDLCQSTNDSAPPTYWKVGGSQQRWADVYKDFGLDTHIYGKRENIADFRVKQSFDDGTFTITNISETEAGGLAFQQNNLPSWAQTNSQFVHVDKGAKTDDVHNEAFKKFTDGLKSITEGLIKGAAEDKANFEIWFPGVWKKLAGDISKSITGCYDDMKMPDIPNLDYSIPFSPDFYVFDDSSFNTTIANATDEQNLTLLLERHRKSQDQSVKKYTRDTLLGGQYLSTNLPGILEERAKYLTQFASAGEDVYGELDVMTHGLMALEGTKRWDPVTYRINDKDDIYMRSTTTLTQSFINYFKKQYAGNVRGNSVAEDEKAKTGYMQSILALSYSTKGNTSTKPGMWAQQSYTTDSKEFIAALYNDQYQTLMMGPRKDFAEIEGRLGGNVSQQQYMIDKAREEAKKANKRVQLDIGDGRLYWMTPDGTMTSANDAEMVRDTGLEGNDYLSTGALMYLKEGVNPLAAFDSLNSERFGGSVLAAPALVGARITVAYATLGGGSGIAAIGTAGKAILTKGLPLILAGGKAVGGAVINTGRGLLKVGSSGAKELFAYNKLVFDLAKQTYRMHGGGMTGLKMGLKQLGYGATIPAKLAGGVLAGPAKMAVGAMSGAALLAAGKAYMDEVAIQEWAAEFKKRRDEIESVIDAHAPAHMKFNDPDGTTTISEHAESTAKAAIGAKTKDLSIRRTYPTFAIYFIEKDEQESEARNGKIIRQFDDFYSYSCIQEIKVTRSRTTASDLAVIRITNVAGKIFRKRYGETAQQQEIYAQGNAESNAHDGKIVNWDSEYVTGFLSGTEKENPFSKLILQDGVMVQIRLGYSQNPEFLESVFLGQIVEVAPAEEGKIIELVCQGYGVELEAVELGPINGGPSFYSTQGALSAAICHPSIVNFGRRGKYNKFSVGESRHQFTGGEGLPFASTIWNELIGEWGTRNLHKSFFKYEWLNEPQDDNIYAPSPYVYSSIWTRFCNNACIYRPIKQTAWEIFKEHELRHPGYIAMAVPYGHETRMTMFFGAPGQHYWCRPTSEEERARSMLFSNQILIMRSADPDQLLKNPENKAFFIQLIKENPDLARAYANDLYSTTTPTEVGKELGKVYGRYIPFRRYHYFSSDHHLLQNQIKTAPVYNEITVNYLSSENVTDLTGEDLVNEIGSSANGGEKSYGQKLDDNIPDNLLRSFSETYPSCVTEDMAKRYVQGLFARHLRNGYRGEFIVLGEPTLKPYDICYLADHSIGMYGPVEVESVTHIFNREQGFISIVTPDMCLAINEYASMNSMDLAGLAFSGIFCGNTDGATAMIGALPAGIQMGLGSTVGAAAAGGGATVAAVGGAALAPVFIGVGAVSLFATAGAIKFGQWLQNGAPCISTPLMLQGAPFASYSFAYGNASIFQTWLGNWKQWWDDVDEGWDAFNIAEFADDKLLDLGIWVSQAVAAGPASSGTQMEESEGQ